jgi:DNA-binding helix-hairpin-helix protein with protein kinase domain
MALAPFTATVTPMAASVPVIAGAVLIAILCRPPRVSAEARAKARDAFNRAEEAWQTLAGEWHAQPAAPDFADKRQAIEGLKASLDALVQEREKRIKALERVITEAEQRARYLGQFRIEDAGLYNMGAARSAVLRSWGIETAAEIDEAKIAEVPGFGRNLTDRLVNWRYGLERKFLFEPAAVADPLEVRKVDREIAVQRMGLMKELRIRVVGLENQIRRIRDDRATLWKRLDVAFNARMLAHQANLAAGNN